jgi:Zn-finger protein
MQGKWQNSETPVLLNLHFHCTHQLFINHRRSATPWIILHIFASLIFLNIVNTGWCINVVWLSANWVRVFQKDQQTLHACTLYWPQHYRGNICKRTLFCGCALYFRLRCRCSFTQTHKQVKSVWNLSIQTNILGVWEMEISKRELQKQSCNLSSIDKEKPYTQK